MKKWIAWAAACLFLFGCAAAEQTVALPGSQRLLTLPDAMQAMPLKQGDDALMAYLSPTLEMDVFSFLNETGKSIQNVAEWMISEGNAAEIRRISGVEMVVFRKTDETSGGNCIGYNFLDGNQVLQVVFWYAGPEAVDEAESIMSTIR